MNNVVDVKVIFVIQNFRFIPLWCVV